MEFIANLEQHKHEWKPIFVNHKLLFHHKKRKWIEDLQLEIWGKGVQQKGGFSCYKM